MNKIHAVDFKLDGSGVVNILDTDDLEILRSLNFDGSPCSRLHGEGAVIIRRFDLTDEEKHRQMEREIFEEPKSAEEKLRTGDPVASLEIVSKAKSKAAAKSEAASSSGIAQVIGETVGQFIKPKTKDQATMVSYKRAPQLPGGLSIDVSKAKSAAHTEERNGVSEAGSSIAPSGSCDDQSWIAFQGATAFVNNNLTEGASTEVDSINCIAIDGACPQDCQEGAANCKCSSPGNG